MNLSIQPEEQRSVTVRAPAKINLHLGVGRPRADGFHPLDTVFQAVGLYDDVRATDGDGTVTVEAAEYLPAGRARGPRQPGRQHRHPRGPAAGRDRHRRPWSCRSPTCWSRSGSPWPVAWPAARPTAPPPWWRSTGCGPWTPPTRRCSTWPPRSAATCRSRCSAARPTAPAAASCCTSSPTPRPGGGSSSRRARGCRPRRSTAASTRCSPTRPRPRPARPAPWRP